MTLVRIRQIIAHDDRGPRGVEVLLDVIEPQNLALGSYIQRAVVHSDPIGLIEAAGDCHHAISLVVAVAIDNGVDLSRPRPDEHRAARTERHLSRVPDAVSKHRDVKSRGNYPLVGRLRTHTAGSGQLRKENDARECSDDGGL